jgi:hypothetical protein
VFGRPALDNIARGFGLRGHEIRDVSVVPKLFADFSRVFAANGHAAAPPIPALNSSSHLILPRAILVCRWPTRKIA